MDLGAATAALTATLRAQRNRDGGWPYYAGKSSRLESTCWAALGIGEPTDDLPLRAWRRQDGLFVEPSVTQVNYAFNALAGLTMGLQGRDLAVGTATALADVFGAVIPESPVIRQKTNLRGWGWTADTFSWVEPTAWCTLLLKKWAPESNLRRARIDEAERVLEDRVCPEGGWNFGNGEVYGQGLPAHVPPTAVAVLALQDRPVAGSLQRAVALLERQAPAEGSTTALALTVLALAALGRPAPALVATLVAHVPTAIAFGNLAVLGMAAYALRCADAGRAPAAFALRAGAA